MAEKHTSHKEPKTAPVKPAKQTEEENLKAVSAVAYLGILFFVPMLVHPKSKFAMFHANQGLLLLITAVAINVIGGIIPFLGLFILLPLGNIFVLILFVIGLINALNGRMKRLPLVGGYDLLKPEETK